MTGRERRLPPVMAACGLGATAALWTLGRLTTPSPLSMGALLAASALLGLALVAPAPRMMAFGAIAGWVCLAGSATFLAVLFRATGDNVAVIRRAVAAGNPGAGVPRSLRLVDYNVLHGYPEFHDQEARTRRLIAALRDLDPTVVVLQEAWWTTRHGKLADRLAAELDMDAAYARANGSRWLIGFEEGGAVLSRLPILAARRVVLSPRRPVWQTRIALFVTLALGDEKLTVVGTHLGGAPGLATAQTRDLVSRLSETEYGVLVVAGDLNAGSDSAAAEALTAHGLSDLVPGGIDHVFMADVPVAAAARSRTGSWRLVDGGWILRPEDLPAPLSDHPGIVVELHPIR